MTPERALTIGILACVFALLLLLVFGAIDINTE